MFPTNYDQRCKERLNHEDYRVKNFRRNLWTNKQGFKSKTSLFRDFVRNQFIRRINAYAFGDNKLVIESSKSRKFAKLNHCLQGWWYASNFSAERLGGGSHYQLMFDTSSLKLCCNSLPVWIFCYSDGTFFGICDNDFKSPEFQLGLDRIVKIETGEVFSPGDLFGTVV